MTGRFLDLLDPGDRDRVVGAYARLPTVNDDALPVQVSCPPLYTRTENVARSPAVLPHLVSLAEHHTPGAGVIPLDDLAVSGDAQRLQVGDQSEQLRRSAQYRLGVVLTVYSMTRTVIGGHSALRAGFSVAR